MHLADEISSLPLGGGCEEAMNSITTDATVAATGIATRTEPTWTTPAGSVASSGQNTKATAELARMLESYSKEIDTIAPRKDQFDRPVVNDGVVVQLTGSTGAIGSYVLDLLIKNSTVRHIYCLNRTADARDRQLKTNAMRGLDTCLVAERVTFLHSDLTDLSLGLPAETYHGLLSCVTHIIHNAWPVNFNKPLSTFTNSIEGVIGLIKFAAASRANSRVQFFSSMSSVFNYEQTTVPEEIILELSTPLSAGYGQSKYLVERLLDHACKTLGISANIFRIGQVAGTARTANGWSQREWFPSLIATSAFLGVLPDSLLGVDKVDWVPIDHLANVLVELVLASQQASSDVGNATIYHVAHPRPVTWTAILPTIKKAVEGSGRAKDPVRVLLYDQFAGYLITTLLANTSLQADPAALKREAPSARLIDFYISLEGGATKGLSLTLSMEKTRAFSPTLANLEPLQDEWIAGWVKEWLDAAAS